ncbi:GAF and ANTAR domain-containing protein [Streptomyces fumanus]|uniref:GAF and ANTAR domain-containing protein n=1 Tax=Streptomyces fumanus TaxID=67302 RepID=UPI001E358BCB|nr:GAF and ANTAR domain-containing protein [Streptomyces fumanus]
MADRVVKEAVGVRPSDDPPASPGRPGPDDDAGQARAVDLIADGVRGVPPDQVPARLCEVAVRLLPVSGASASLRGDGVPVRLCASGERAGQLAEIQATLGEGPSVHAAATGLPVLVHDLTRGADAVRWPVYAQQITAAGVRAVYALPLGTDAMCVGTLDLYRDTPGTLTPAELHTARLVAGVLTVALMALPREDEADRVDGQSWLNGLATGHDEVYRAVGMIMAQLGVGTDEALARLRAHAFAGGRTVREAAQEVLTHRHRFDTEER